MGPSLLVWLSSLQVKLVFVTMEKTLILNVSGPVCCTQVLTRDTIFELSSSQVRTRDNVGAAWAIVWLSSLQAQFAATRFFLVTPSAGGEPPICIV